MPRSHERLTPTFEPPIGALSPRERDVARCVARGLSNEETAKELGITKQTVKNHMTSIFSKLGVSSRLQLAVAVLGERLEIRRQKPTG
jgi:DNA-binding NarL/FixJ family response regulator